MKRSIPVRSSVKLWVSWKMPARKILVMNAPAAIRLAQGARIIQAFRAFMPPKPERPISASVLAGKSRHQDADQTGKGDEDEYPSDHFHTRSRSGVAQELAR